MPPPSAPITSARSAALFDWFHRNPELSFKEAATAARMAKELRAIPGIEVTEKVGGHRRRRRDEERRRADGAGARRHGRAAGRGKLGPRQRVEGRAGRHRRRREAGHARLRARHAHHLAGRHRAAAGGDEGPWKGTVVFIVQPAEERIGGAKAMLEDGLYTRFPKPDYALAFHVDADLADGQDQRVANGLQYSSADSVDIIVHGVGAHGASPHTGQGPDRHRRADRHGAADAGQPRDRRR